MKRLFLVRGLPGSGKSTLAKLLAWGTNAYYTREGDEHESIMISADDSFHYLTGPWKQMIDMARDHGSYRDKQALDQIEIDLRDTPPVDGAYSFHAALLPFAHRVCENRVQDAMISDDPYYSTVIVHNTFSQPWEAMAYYRLAKNYEYDVFVIEAQNSFNNTHNVPQRQIDAMQARWLPLYDPGQRK